MQHMLAIASAFVGLLFLRPSIGFPYALSDSTTPFTNSTPDGSLILPFLQPQALNNTSISQYKCTEIYPSDLTVLNARYPDYNEDHLHRATQFFMLRRQLAADGEIATRVQFTDLPNSTSNRTCRLEFVLPREELQHIQGHNPSFNVYQVEREAGAVATWQTYSNSEDSRLLFGIVNGEADALERTRTVGGVAAVNETQCNETLSFQMALKYDSEGEAPNYWEFLNVGPPAWPVQGFRIVYGC